MDYRLASRLMALEDLELLDLL